MLRSLAIKILMIISLMTSSLCLNAHGPDDPIDINSLIKIVYGSLKEQGVNCKIIERKEKGNNGVETIPLILISTSGEHYLNKLSRSMSRLGIEITFDIDQLLTTNSKAVFSWGEDNALITRINLSTSFIESMGSDDKASLRHETRHFLFHVLRIFGYDSIYSGWIEDNSNSEYYKKSFYLEEIPINIEDLYTHAKKLEVSEKVISYSKTIDRLIGRSLNVIEIISDMKGQASFYAQDIEAWCYYDNDLRSFLRFQKIYNEESKNWVYSFAIRINNDFDYSRSINYELNIAVKEKVEDPLALFFNRIEEQKELLLKYKEAASNIDEAIKASDPEKLLSTTKEIRGISKESTSSEPTVKDRLTKWKSHLKKNLAKLKIETTFSVPVNNAYMKEYSDNPDSLFKMLAEKGFSLSEEDIDLLFGEKDVGGERHGGIYNYWSKNINEGDNWIYVALVGALVYDLYYSDRSISLTILSAYKYAKIINTTAMDIREEITKKQLLPETNIDNVIMKIDIIRASSIKKTDIKLP